MAKCPTVQTAFCGNQIYASCICMAWTYLVIDVFMLMVALSLFTTTSIHFQRIGGLRSPRDDYWTTEPHWLAQVSEVSMSYALTNLLLCMAWLFTRAGLLLGLYKESVSALGFWCCMSVVMMALQLLLAGALSVLLLAARRLGDLPFIAGCALILLQIVFYVDGHMYVTLVAWSVQQLIKKRLLAAHSKRVSPSNPAHPPPPPPNKPLDAV